MRRALSTYGGGVLTYHAIVVAFGLLLGSCDGGDAPKVEDPLATDDMKGHAPDAVRIGWDYFEKGDLDTALRRFEMAVRHDAAFAPGYYGIAYVHSARGQLDEAIKYYRLSLEHDQTYPYTYANLGLALLQKEQFAEAVKMLDRALELKPDCGEAHLSYANYYAFKGDWKNAEISVNKALHYGQSIDPEFRAMLEANGVSITASTAAAAVGADDAARP